MGDFTTKEDVLKTIAPLGWLLILGSVIELFLASKLPNKMALKSKKIFSIRRYARGEYLFNNLRIIRRKREIFQAIISLSLFWSISQVILAIFGEYAKSNLGITNTIIVQGVMALAGIGIVIGSILAAKLSRYYINMGVVSIGSIGIMIVVFIIPFSSSIMFLAFLFILFGIFSGLLMVPLNARIQFLSPNIHLGTILAGSNFIQNIFMVSFLVLTTFFAYFGMNAKALFYLMGFVAVFMSIILFKRYLTATFWTVMEIISMFRHKYNYVGLENIPQNKGVLLLGNHVSWLDWVILQLPMQRQINFMMDKEIYNWKFLHHFFKKGEAIPVSPKASKDAFKEVYKRLKDGKIVTIYPEGGISKSAELGVFFRGYELIPKDYDGVIVPFFIDGVFGSRFAKYKPKKKKSFFKRREITVYFGEPISKETKVDELKAIIQNMKDTYETK